MKPTDKKQTEAGYARVKVLTEHRLNFGTAEKPMYKTKDDEIGCDLAVAERLAAAGHVEILKGDNTDVE